MNLPSVTLRSLSLMNDDEAARRVSAATQRRRYLEQEGLNSITNAAAVEHRLTLLPQLPDLHIRADVVEIATLRVSQPDWSLAMLAGHAGISKEAFTGRLRRFVHAVDGEFVRTQRAAPPEQLAPNNIKRRENGR